MPEGKRIIVAPRAEAAKAFARQRKWPKIVPLGYGNARHVLLQAERTAEIHVIDNGLENGEYRDLHELLKSRFTDVQYHRT